MYYKNVNNLLPSYFRSFAPQFNDGHQHDLRHNILRLPMTKREYFVECTRYQFLKLIRETPLVELNRSGYITIVQFSGHFKYYNQSVRSNMHHQQFVDYPDLSVLLVLVLSHFIFSILLFDLLETLYVFHCNHYFHKYIIFSNSRINTEYAPYTNRL